MNKDNYKWGEFYPAPAKINLMLHIIGQREDGYHLLQTVFQFVNLCDELAFFSIEDDSVSLVNSIDGILESDNLVIRAALLLKNETQCKKGVRIEIKKNIPMGGGLGGGSSDAATTLVVLNELWNLNLSKETLLKLALQLGADVPVFVYGYAAWAEGVGEKLESINLPERWIILIKPDCHVNTKSIFLAKNLTRNSKSMKMCEFSVEKARNDCENVVFEQYPIIENAFNNLSNITKTRLTGTGCCVFGLFETEESAKKAHEKLKSQWNVFLGKTISKSPLFI